MQVFQARYQNARHYARRAMGKAASMDVAHTETLTEAHGGLYAIVALVVIAQAWQVRTGTEADARERGYAERMCERRMCQVVALEHARRDVLTAWRPGHPSILGRGRCAAQTYAVPSTHRARCPHIARDAPAPLCVRLAFRANGCLLLRGDLVPAPFAAVLPRLRDAARTVPRVERDAAVVRPAPVRLGRA